LKLGAIAGQKSAPKVYVTFRNFTCPWMRRSNAVKAGAVGRGAGEARVSVAWPVVGEEAASETPFRWRRGQRGLRGGVVQKGLKLRGITCRSVALLLDPPSMVAGWCVASPAMNAAAE